MLLPPAPDRRCAGSAAASGATFVSARTLALQMRIWPVVLGGLLLAGCGGSAQTSSPPGDEPAVPAITPRGSGSPVAAAVPRPPNPPSSVPTRLAGGPIVLRVVGARHRPLLRYVLIFRLNRPYPRWPRDPADPDGPAPLPGNAADPLGNFSIAGFEFDFSRSIFNLDPVGRPDQDNCFSGNLDAGLPEDPGIIPRLDAIRDGGRVRVRLRPLTPTREGRPAYGPAYVRHPRIIVTHVRPYDREVTGYRDRSTPGLYLKITSRGALRALKRMGCSATVLY